MKSPFRKSAENLMRSSYSWLSYGMVSGFAICACGFVLVQLLYK
jgi:hypothetical protein